MQIPKPFDDHSAFIHEPGTDSEIVHVFGDIDLANKDTFEKAIADAAQSGRNVTVNLTKCHYIDSTALSVLCKSHSTLGKRLGVVAAPGPVQRIFDISGVGEFLGVTYEATSASSIVA